ncbi:hypothetical protein [Streptosporangium carneum]|uniref:MAPEG family protein n=1 Tax=Streptosporangium carneum TaxID=47481 RepID=A0A9W6MAI7_9ACTN|nr:hypothetical protein [Streptosporangium carneum]GLK07344.1 hypothetical protein GCM10017600_07490 [Streptosporangium carneum]
METIGLITTYTAVAYAVAVVVLFVHQLVLARKLVRLPPKEMCDSHRQLHDFIRQGPTVLVFRMLVLASFQYPTAGPWRMLQGRFIWWRPCQVCRPRFPA